MIFVTVGTHEQQFNRLVEYMDEYAATTDEEIIIQTGFSTYEPKHCKWQKLYSYKEMHEFVEKARIVITHGGPSSFIMPLQLGKVPIVVPRQQKYGEHVNNHQLYFCEEVSNRMKTIITVASIGKLGDTINNYDELICQFCAQSKSNNDSFVKEFSKIVDGMFTMK